MSGDIDVAFFRHLQDSVERHSVDALTIAQTLQKAMRNLHGLFGAAFNLSILRWYKDAQLIVVQTAQS